MITLSLLFYYSCSNRSVLKSFCILVAHLIHYLFRKKALQTDFIKMGLDFYMLPGSAPCSIVQMTAKAVGVELNLKPVDLFTGEHLEPEYLKVK